MAVARAAPAVAVGASFVLATLMLTVLVALVWALSVAVTATDKLPRIVVGRRAVQSAAGGIDMQPAGQRRTVRHLGP